MSQKQNKTNKNGANEQHTEMVTNGMMLIHKSTQILVQKHVRCSKLGIQQTQKWHQQIKNAGGHLSLRKNRRAQLPVITKKGDKPYMYAILVQIAVQNDATTYSMW